jgi:hypothetical protein
MSKKRFLKQIRGLERVIAEHQNKIETEKMKAVPDLGMIKYWEKEIEGYKAGIIKANKRLKRGR